MTNTLKGSFGNEIIDYYNSVSESFLIFSKKNKFSSLFYHSLLDCFWSLKDVAYLNHISKKRFSTLGVFFLPVFFSSAIISRVFYTGTCLSSKDKIFLYPARNSLIVVNLSKGIVTKIVKTSQFNFFMNNETIAMKHFENHYIPTLELSTNGDFSHSKTKYIYSDKRLKSSDWSCFLSSVWGDLFDFYSSVGIQELSFNDYVRQLLDSSKEQLNSSSFFNSDLRLITKLFEEIIMDMNLSSDDISFKTHVHGDLTLSNILLTKNTYYLFDWVNGGKMNLLYDLMMQEFYNSNFSFWNNFKIISISDLNNYFFSSFDSFSQKYALKLGKKLSLSDFKRGILLSLFELAIRNHSEYQLSDRDSGKLFLRKIIRILKIIRGA